jgi:hypothetical protein
MILECGGLTPLFSDAKGPGKQSAVKPAQSK